MAVVATPSLGSAMDYLRGLGMATVDLRLTRLLDTDADVESAQARVAASDLVMQAFAGQRQDGSWGENDKPGRRLLPTLWMVKTLGELGLDARHDGWLRATRFLESIGHTDEGVFSLWGNREGVLSCYVGLAASIYLDGGLPDLAAPQIDWILRYQEVRAGGSDLRPSPVATYSAHLKTRYGGCMAETTCLVGLLREGRALSTWGGADGLPLVGAIRRAFLERRVMFRSDGSIVPLAVSPRKADSWLQPSFPLDWRVDLIETVDFLTHSGPADERMQEAVDRIVSFQLPDGTWSLRRAYRPVHLPRVENRSSRKSSPMVTLRVVEALWPLVT